MARLTRGRGRDPGPSPRTWGERRAASSRHPMPCGPSPRTWGEPTIHAGTATGYRRTDHPHARGENAPDRSDRYRCRTIPTHVGRTHCRVTREARRADHPHARGENGVREPVGEPMPDHPHARGENVHVWPVRSTASDHPHARGENVTRRLVVATSVHSDHPHARGENSSSDLGDVAADHPHARGENCCASRRPADSGPSPRTWGERATAAISLVTARTIPTHVGRTLDFPGFNSRFQAKRRVFRMGQPVQHPPISRRPSTGHSPRCPCGRLGQLCRFCSPGNLGNC